MRYILLPLLVVSTILISITTFDYFNKLILSADISGLGVFLNFLGVVYAIISAFVIFDAGGRFNNINEELSKEFMALRNLFSMINVMKDKNLLQFSKEKIKDYALTLKKNLYVNGSKTKKEASKKFRMVFLILEKIKPKSESEKILAGHAIDALRSSANSRSRRIGLIESEIPKLELFLVMFLSMSLVFGFFLVRLSNIYIFTTLMFIISAAVSFIMLIIFDLNMPFKGFWNVSSDPIDRTLEFLEEK
ncbi:MAG: DUF4239 domain-containing protein [Candidatus Aenigmarchaeota archaeon]|nr:DUF4239 domain-containing protein [Candidatus Aenigmarchaeota archaeon]